MKKRTLLLLPATLSLLMVSNIQPGKEYLSSEDFNVYPVEEENKREDVVYPVSKPE